MVNIWKQEVRKRGRVKVGWLGGDQEQDAGLERDEDDSVTYKSLFI